MFKTQCPYQYLSFKVIPYTFQSIYMQSLTFKTVLASTCIYRFIFVRNGDHVFTAQQNKRVYGLGNIVQMRENGAKVVTSMLNVQLKNI